MSQNSEIHKGHRQRLRQRIRTQGLDRLEPHEIIEYLLGYAIPRRDTNPIAHALIERFGSVRGVLFAGTDELCQVKGVGPRTAHWLASLGEAVKGYRSLDPADRPEIRNPLGLFRYASRLRRCIQPPCSMQLCLDAHGFLVMQRRLTPSRAWGERECLRRALEDMLGSSAVCSVILQFSREDLAAEEEYDVCSAQSYAATLNAAGCLLLDVVIVGETKIISLHEKNLIPRLPAAASAAALREDYSRDMPACDALCMQALEENDGGTT